MLEKDDRDFLQPEKLGSFKTTVAGDNLAVLVDQNRRIEFKRFDAFGDSPNLSAAMLARVARMRRKSANGLVRDLFLAHCVHPKSLRWRLK